MWAFREQDDWDFADNALTFALGATGGFAIGVLLSGRGRSRPNGSLGGGLRDRARSVASRLRPTRRYRLEREQSELTALEDAVLDVFLADLIVGERPIDVGAISRGIIELSGSVWTHQEADLAVRLARRVEGVETVVNRMEIDDERRHAEHARQHMEDSSLVPQPDGRSIGMGTRRQGSQTDPDRPDDSQHMQERELEQADRDEWTEEGLAAARPRMGERPEESRPRQDLHFDEDELDNQDPHGKHATRTLDSPPQDRNTAARVGEGPKPGVELRLEEADLPVKPHSRD